MEESSGWLRETRSERDYGAESTWQATDKHQVPNSLLVRGSKPCTNGLSIGVWVVFWIRDGLERWDNVLTQRNRCGSAIARARLRGIYSH